MHLINFALRLLRLATEALFTFELNRILGRCISGKRQHLHRKLATHELSLLRQIQSPHHTTKVHLPSGLHLHTLIAGHDPPGPRPLVLLHGHSMAAALFSTNIDSLLHAGYTSVFAPDLPGWGGSSRPRFTGAGSEEALRFYLAPFCQWLAALPLQRFTLLGHSLGAYVAHEYALRYGFRLHRLLLTSPAALTRTTDVRTAVWFAFTPQRFLTHGGLIARVLFSCKYPRQMCYNLRGMREYLFCANSIDCATGDAAAAAMLRFWRGEGTAEWRAECVSPLLERVQRLQCPVDLISGDSDPLVRLDSVRILYRRMVEEGNMVTLSVIPGADHTPHLSSPDKFAKAIMRGMAPEFGEHHLPDRRADKLHLQTLER